VSTIIFDFDGTIADSFVLAMAIAHELAGWAEPLPAAEIRRLRGMSLLKVAEDLKIRPWKIPFLVARGRAQMRAKMPEVDAFHGMPEAIKALHDAGHDLYIMSSNSAQNIELFLERYKMNQEFIKISGSVGLFGKARVLKKIIKQNSLDQSDTFYVGDEVRDIEAAKRAGIRIISVAWGYNNEAVLVAHQPDFMVRKPLEIPKLFSPLHY
jgi:phosphoglycolate phosphatase